MKHLSQLAAIVILLIAALAATGCIRSHLIIDSVPSGADVKFHGADQGQTPVDIPFIWYWYYDIDVTKSGFQPVHAIERLSSPPWLYFPLDFFAELMPFRITDTHRRTYTLKPVEKP